ncbi:hypothetical protein E2562_023074, partial [Oryza meyeriana var. granulata]
MYRAFNDVHKSLELPEAPAVSQDAWEDLAGAIPKVVKIIDSLWSGGLMGPM